MQVPFILLLSYCVSGLHVKQELDTRKSSWQDQSSGKYAYVTMWINKENVPKHVFEKVLSKSETTWLNQAAIGDGGAPLLYNGQKIKTSLAQTDDNADESDETEQTEDQDENKEENKGEEKKQKKKKNRKMKQEPAPENVFHMPLRPRNGYEGILDIAQNLRDVGSQVPLYVLTNEQVFKNASLQAENPNLKFIWLKDQDFIKRSCHIGFGHELHFQKLQIFRLTQFEKVAWIDSDVAFTKNVDYIFTHPRFKLTDGSRIYGQTDDYKCDGRQWSPTSGGVCSGMLLIKPTTTHYTGLVMAQQKMQNCWGDQSIIGTYFTSTGKEAKPLDRRVINFARCHQKDGWMDAVHFSGSPGAKRVGDTEKRRKDGSLINATQVALEKAALKEKAERKKALDEHKEEMQAARNKKRWAQQAREAKAKK